MTLLPSSPSYFLGSQFHMGAILPALCAPCHSSDFCSFWDVKKTEIRLRIQSQKARSPPHGVDAGICRLRGCLVEDDCALPEMYAHASCLPHTTTIMTRQSQVSYSTKALEQRGTPGPLGPTTYQLCEAEKVTFSVFQSQITLSAIFLCSGHNSCTHLLGLLHEAGGLTDSLTF